VAAPPAAITARSYFSSPGPHGGKFFRFDYGATMGCLYYRSGKTTPASGVVIVPPGEIFDFVPGEQFFRHPELFAHFRPDEIACLNCGIKSALPWTDKHLDFITENLTGLEGIDLTDSEIDGAGVVLLNRLKQLDGLQVNGTKLTGRDLLRLDRLRDLTDLQISQIKDVPLLLDKLRGGRKLLIFEAVDCGLTDSDMQTIAAIPSLRSLALDRNQISLTGLKYLLKLPKVDRLALGSVRFGPDCIGCMGGFKRVKELRFDMAGWSEADKERLRKALAPGCKIVQDPLDSHDN
jgi:hypothetical protein